MLATRGGDGKPEGKQGREVVNCGRGGKVLRKSNSDEDTPEDEEGDASMSEANDGEVSDEVEGVRPKKDDATDKTAKDTPKPKKSTTAKAFSLVPVPSFHYQDLQRVRILQNEMVLNRRDQMKERNSVSLHLVDYNKAFKLSVELQQEKVKVEGDLNTMMEDYRNKVAGMNISGKLAEKSARSHWEKRRAQLKDMVTVLGPARALERSACNDALQDLKDRVCIRTAEQLAGSGLGTHCLARAASEARADGDEPRRVAAIMLGHAIDGVERRRMDAAANSLGFVPPRTTSAECVVANPVTGETLAQVHEKEVEELKRRMKELKKKFEAAERKRYAAWEVVNKAKGGSVGQASGSGSRSKSKGRKSAGGTPGSHQGGGANARVAASAAPGTASLSANNNGCGQSYPTQMQASSKPTARPMPLRAQPPGPRPANPQPSGGGGGGSSTPGPGYVPSYYQAGRQQQGLSASAPSSYQVGSHHRPAAANSSSSTAVATILSRSSVPTAASMMSAQIAAARFVPTNQVTQGRAPASATPSAQQMAQMAALQTMMGQQSRRMQQPQPQQHRVLAQGGGGPRSGGGGVQFHPVVPQRSFPAANAAASSYGPPMEGPARSAMAGNGIATAATAFDRNLHPASAAGDMQQHQPPLPPCEPATKVSTLSKYGYGDKYSATNVNARKNPDGTIVPASTPKLLPDGRFARPAGRQRKGMDWDAANGWWVPQQQGPGGGMERG